MLKVYNRVHCTIHACTTHTCTRVQRNITLCYSITLNVITHADDSGDCSDDSAGDDDTMMIDQRSDSSSF